MMRLYLICLIICLSHLLRAQVDGLLVFESMNHDFGTISQSGGPVRHSFVFTNGGNHSIQLINVNSSCGCTVPEWSGMPLEPQDTGKIVVAFNPLNRPGLFYKTLLVETNNKDAVYKLSIQGKVLPSQDFIEVELPVKIGNLRFKYQSLNLGKVVQGRNNEKTFPIYNDSDDPIPLLSFVISKPAHIDLAFEPDTLAPKQRGEIRVIYNSQDLGLGYRADHLTIIDSMASTPINLDVFATVEEKIDLLQKGQLKNAPRIEFFQTEYDFGKIEQDEIVTKEIAFTNTGFSDLTIKEVKSNCGCLIARLSEDVIHPNDTAKLSILLDPESRRGSQYKMINIYSNDPLNPNQRILIKARIKVDK